MEVFNSCRQLVVVGMNCEAISLKLDFSLLYKNVSVGLHVIEISLAVKKAYVGVKIIEYPYTEV